jgi:3-deoxy-D-manno-octulosonic acid kinase
LKETVKRTEAGAILYDQSILNQISEAGFSPEGWVRAVPVEGALRSAGRGSTIYVSDGNREFVLRHYVRGGLIGRVDHDRYLWLGEERNRAFAEWRLLARLAERDFPVPRPAAARYARTGLWYTADLLTVKAPGVTPLSVRLTHEPADADFWRSIGRDIRRFHDAGVYHADLNAYNVQVDEGGRLFLLDFDRGEIRPPGRWQDRNLARLHRSLRKLKRLDLGLRFDERNWDQVLEGYVSVR